MTSKYDNTHHALPEPLLCLRQLRSLHIRFPSLTSIQSSVSKLTALQRLRIEGLQGSLSIEPGALLQQTLVAFCLPQLLTSWAVFACVGMRLRGTAPLLPFALLLVYTSVVMRALPCFPVDSRHALGCPSCGTYSLQGSRQTAGRLKMSSGWRVN